MKILLAPDKFKGSLSATGVCTALEKGWASVDPESEFVSAPIADGGEGFSEALCCALGGQWIEVGSVDALGREIQCRYVWEARSRTAVLEMSESAGLWRLKSEELNPYRANTYGVGILMRDAVRRGASKILIGLGGSATTDGGIGMAAALGCRFFGESGTELEPLPENLGRIEHVDVSGCIPIPGLVAACDVQNPLLGERGTAAVFSPQKGADLDAVRFLENGLQNLAARMRSLTGRDDGEVRGAGAAGGIAYGLLSFCGARLEGGFELVAGAMDLKGRVEAADLVLTGEGRVDGQTLEGKGPAGVAAMARGFGRKVIAFAGSVSEDPEVHAQFDAIVPIVDGVMELGEAMGEAPRLLERAAARTARMLKLKLR